MRSLKKVLRLLCLSMICLNLFCMTSAFAVEADVQTGSITCLSYLDGKVVSDVKFNAWHVADYDSVRSEFVLKSDYVKYDVLFRPNDVDVMTGFVKTLYNYIQRDGIQFDKSVVSDSRGVASFELIRPGVYLIGSDSFVRDGWKYTSTPMLVYIPNLSDSGKLIYSAEIEAKFVGTKIPDETHDTITRRVLKTWTGDVKSDRPEYITVELLKDGRVHDTVRLSEKNSWRYVWNDLDAGFAWEVVEYSVPDGYKTYVDRKGITFVVENVRESSETPPEPWEPVNPSYPDPVEPSYPDPVEPNYPVTPIEPGNPSTPQVPSDPKIPQTGQLWWPVPVLTLLGLLVLLIGVFVKFRGRNVCIFVGVALILASLGLTMYNLYEDEAVIASMPDPDEIVQTIDLVEYDAEYIPDYVLDESFDMPEIEYSGRSYIGRLDIDVLGLSLPVQSELTYPNLKVSPARYVGDIYDGTCIIGAHNYNSHFGKLKNLNPGDELSFTDSDGNAFSYKVKQVDVLDGKDVSGLCAGDWDMTLFTCTYGGKSRVTVRCDCVSGLERFERV